MKRESIDSCKNNWFCFIEILSLILLFINTIRKDYYQMGFKDRVWDT